MWRYLINVRKRDTHTHNGVEREKILKILGKKVKNLIIFSLPMTKNKQLKGQSHSPLHQK